MTRNIKKRTFEIQEEDTEVKQNWEMDLEWFKKEKKNDTYIPLLHSLVQTEW